MNRLALLALVGLVGSGLAARYRSNGAKSAAPMPRISDQAAGRLYAAGQISGLGMSRKYVAQRANVLLSDVTKLNSKYNAHIQYNIERLLNLMELISQDDPLGSTFDALLYETVNIRNKLSDAGASDVELVNVDYNLSILHSAKHDEATRKLDRRVAMYAYSQGLNYTVSRVHDLIYGHLRNNYQLALGHNYNPKKLNEAIVLQLAYNNIPNALQQARRLRKELKAHGVTKFSSFDKGIALIRQMGGRHSPSKIYS